MVVGTYDDHMLTTHFMRPFQHIHQILLVPLLPIMNPLILRIFYNKNLQKQEKNVQDLPSHQNTCDSSQIPPNPAALPPFAPLPRSQLS